MNVMFHSIGENTLCLGVYVCHCCNCVYCIETFYKAANELRDLWRQAVFYDRENEYDMLKTWPGEW